MPFLSRRFLLVVSLAAATTPALAQFTLSDADKAAILGHALPVLEDEDVDLAFGTSQGRSMISLFAGEAEKHVAARDCAAAPRGETWRTHARALLIDMGKSAAATVRAPLRLSAAFERLVATEGPAKAEALVRALADPNVRRFIDLHRPLHRAQLVDGIYADLSREFAERSIAIFQDTENSQFAITMPDPGTDMSEALALEERLKDDPAFRLYREMKGPMLAAVEATVDQDALRALATLSLVDRFKDRLAILCIG
jgi:hypothetical protein